MGQGQVVAGEKEKIDTKSVSPSFFRINVPKRKAITFVSLSFPFPGTVFLPWRSQRTTDTQ